MKYNFYDEPKSVTVITPTIGQRCLTKAVESVDQQSYKNIKHVVVVDGNEFLDNVNDLKLIQNEKLSITVTPENTGKTTGDFYGHRIYAAYPHLINSHYVAFLDEDNWYDGNHIETLVNHLEENKNDWVYSLRKIYDKEGNYIIDDCCESIGKWPVFWSVDKQQKEYLVDTSSYLFRRDFLIQVCQHWHSGWGGDRRFYHIISKSLNHTNYDTTGEHTLCYRLDDNIDKKYGSINFFKDGNNAIKEHYGDYPWKKRT